MQLENIPSSLVNFDHASFLDENPVKLSKSAIEKAVQDVFSKVQEWFNYDSSDGDDASYESSLCEAFYAGEPSVEPDGYKTYLRKNNLKVKKQIDGDLDNFIRIIPYHLTFCSVIASRDKKVKFRKDGTNLKFICPW